MKEETKYFILRDTIMVVCAIAVFVAVDKAIGQDVLKPLRMRALLTAKRIGQNQADAWQKFADTAATSYHQAHL